VFSLSVSVQLGVSDYRSAGCTSMHQIADWLEKLGISEYTQRFAENDIDTSVLPHLSDQDLKELGISLGHRRKMLAAIGELAGAAPATPKPVAATETKTQDPAERQSGFLKHNGDRVRSTASETGDGGDASLAIGRRSISDALDRNFLQVADEAIDELRHAVELDSHQAPPLAEGSGWPGAEEVIEEDRQREPVGPRSLPSTPVPEPYCSPPRPRVWIGIVMRFAGAAAVAAVIAALVVWKTSWNMNNGHLDQGPPVASGLSRPVESDDGDRTIIASRRPARAAPKLAVGEESAPSRDTLAGAATSQQREPSPSVQEATPPTAPAAPKLAVGEEGAPPRDTLAGAAMSQQREPSARVQEAIPPTAQTMAPGFVTRQLERDEVVLLVKRGEDFITSGDLSSARLVLQRAAEAGDMHAALALAGTFDPNLLAKGFAADVVMSRFWYERAKQFGSTEAPQRLEQLESSVKSAP
jgi:SAM domain (Sterile alpha motif)